MPIIDAQGLVITFDGDTAVNVTFPVLVIRILDVAVEEVLPVRKSIMPVRFITTPADSSLVL